MDNCPPDAREWDLDPEEEEEEEYEDYDIDYVPCDEDEFMEDPGYWDDFGEYE